MTTFGLYLSLGIEHIADIAAFDHILFLTALCAVYGIRQWKKLLILVTAFTVGHTLTLALATLDLFRIPTDIIEFLIPLTIFITGVGNLFQGGEKLVFINHRIKYGIALFFGLIHGLGFSNYLRSLLGAERDLILPLFSFNIGLEIGQVGIVLIVLLSSFLLVDIIGMKRRIWNLMLSGVAMAVSLVLCIERWPAL